jgi:hypothetical protein
VKVPTAPAYLPVPPTIAPETSPPIPLPPTFRAKPPPATFAVPEHVPLRDSPGEGCVAMQNALISPTVLPPDSWSGAEKAKPLPASRVLLDGLPMNPKCFPPLSAGSVRVTVPSEPCVPSDPQPEIATPMARTASTESPNFMPFI